MTEEENRYVQSLEQRIERLERLMSNIDAQSVRVRNLVITGTLKMGEGSTTIRADRRGIWMGQEKLESILTDGLKGTAIEIDGTFTNNP